MRGRRLAPRGGCYPAATVRLVEIRLLEGPNVFRLEPAVKVEIALGRRRTWHGARLPRDGSEARIGAVIGRTDWPDEVDDLVAWLGRLRRVASDTAGAPHVYRSSDPGHWIVTYPWRAAERARNVAEAAVDLTAHRVTPARRVTLTGAQSRLLARWTERISAAGSTPPAWIRDADRQIPVISVTGTNGKSTVARLITHILVRAGRRVGTTTSDGVLVDERLVEAGDWTGPGGAHQVLSRSGLDAAVLETARGGILLRGIGYESNEVSILTNVSSDHLDLQGIHTLPQLAEVKATVCRITSADGWVVLNADDPLVAAVARRVRGHVAFFSLDPGHSPVIRRHLGRGGRAYVRRDGRLLELEDGRSTEIAAAVDLPITLVGLATHNVANALAAAAGARGLGLSIEDVAAGLRDFRPTAGHSPGRLNVFRVGSRIVIVDFAHNEAGIAAVLDVAEGIAAGAGGPMAPITTIVGTAGDRPDDTLRGIGRIAASRSQRVAIKETIGYLRGRSRQSIIDELMTGIRSAGGASDVPVYGSEVEALRAELAAATTSASGRPERGRIIVLLCHAERPEVLTLLAQQGARPVEGASELVELAPRLADRLR